MEPILIHTMSGKQVDLLNFPMEDIQLYEICHRMSQVCRFAGATPVFYSVAEHSLNLDKYVCRLDSSRSIPAKKRKQLHIAALLHDAAEAYIGDMIAPLKHVTQYGGEICKLEDALLNRIYCALTGQLQIDYLCIKRYHASLMTAEFGMFCGDHRVCHYADLISGESMSDIAGQLYRRFVDLGVKKHG